MDTEAHVGREKTSTPLPRTVVVLGWASFFTDFSGEMIYPLLPVFLAGTLGAGPLPLGVIEGAAEATASLLKAVSGRIADRRPRRKPLVLAGYALSSVARPLVALAQTWPAVLAVRVTDRFGKGVRGSPRDALIADATPEGRRGRAYGFQQAMDHAGAVAGPLVAALLLTRGGRVFGLRGIFALAAVPGLFAILALALGVREPPRAEQRRSPPFGRGARQFSPSLAGLRELGPGYTRLLGAALIFTLGNSTDAFLLLRLGAAGLTAAAVAALWAAHHVVKMLCTLAGGNLADRVGPRAMMIAGWAWYALIYLAFACVSSPAALVAVFLAYGAYFGLTDPAQNSWVASVAPAEARATAFGYFSLTVGLAALPASLLFGWIGQTFSVPAAFALGAALAASGCLLLLRVPTTAITDPPAPRR